MVNASHSIGDMMTSSNGNIFRVTDHLCGEFTGKSKKSRNILFIVGTL